ncbi:MAG: VOC family protein [Clostridia bacterium]|nr:VOC family protein [Clostridia bacterium]
MENVCVEFTLRHVGVNAKTPEESLRLVKLFSEAFGFAVKEGNSSNFAGSCIEVMKTPYLGKNGHIAIGASDMEQAVALLKQRGFEMDESTAKYKNGELVAIYLKEDFGGFAVHLVR